MELYDNGKQIIKLVALGGQIIKLVEQGQIIKLV